MNTIRVVLADDHALVRAGLRKLLESMERIEVVGEADDGLALLNLVAEQQPHLVLVDIAMPGLNGLDATARLVKAWPSIKVLVLSMYQNDEYIRQALHCGASAYILKDAAPIELELAFKAVLGGTSYLSPAVSKMVMSDYTQRLRLEAQSPEHLTSRQREVLQLIAEGKSGKEIARRLDISIKTVESHRSQLMKQLGIHEVAGLVRHAMRIGLITPDT